MLRSATTLGLSVLLAASATPACAQVKLSEPATISQTVDGTKIALEYGRPSTRGRSRIFGGEVHWDEVWTPGANWATTLETDKDVTLEGHPIPKGKYSVWLVVKERGEWTLLLAKEARLWHTNRPTAEQELVRIPVTPQWTADTVETLTWDFPVVKPDRTVLRVQWGTMRIPLHIAVTPSRTLTAEQRARYVGTYLLERGRAVEGEWSPERGELRVFEQDGKLRARLTPAPPGHDAEFDLVSAMTHWFFPAYYLRGVSQGAETDLLVGFEVRDGKVTEVQIDDANNRTILKGNAPR